MLPVSENLYYKLLQQVETLSDIREHLFTLMGYALDCEHITEMGVRDVVSTWAFLAAKPKKLVSIDINYTPNIEEAILLATQNDIQLEFKVQSTIADNFEIEETDLLFIDTLHTYSQLKKELFMHGNRARKYLIFHDTTHFAYENEPNNIREQTNLWMPAGLRPAITEFVNANPHWGMCNWYDNNNGLSILRRTS